MITKDQIDLLNSPTWYDGEITHIAGDWVWRIDSLGSLPAGIRHVCLPHHVKEGGEKTFTFGLVRDRRCRICEEEMPRGLYMATMLKYRIL